MISFDSYNKCYMIYELLECSSLMTARVFTSNLLKIAVFKAGGKLGRHVGKNDVISANGLVNLIFTIFTCVCIPRVAYTHT